MESLGISAVKAVALAAAVISPAVVGALVVAGGGEAPERTVALVPRIQAPQLPESWSLPPAFPIADSSALASDLTGLTAAFAAAAALSVPQALPGRLTLGAPARRPAPAPSAVPAPSAGLATMSAPPPVFGVNWAGLFGRWF